MWYNKCERYVGEDSSGHLSKTWTKDKVFVYYSEYPTVCHWEFSSVEEDFSFLNTCFSADKYLLLILPIVWKQLFIAPGVNTQHYKNISDWMNYKPDICHIFMSLTVLSHTA